MLKGKELVGPSQAARMIGCSEQTIRNLADRGQLPCVKTAAGARLFRLGDVAELARQRGAHREEDR